MLDAIAQTLAEQTAKPAIPDTAHPPNAPLVASQQTVAPTPKPTVSAPEALSPAFLSQPNSSQPNLNDSTQATAKSALTASTAPENAPPSIIPRDQSAQRLNMNGPVGTTPNQTADQAAEQATAAQRLVLKQRLADLVAKDKLQKEAKLKANLEALVIASAQAGQLLQARRLAQDPRLSPANQAALLAQIDAIDRTRVPTKRSTLPRSLSTLPRSLSTTVPIVIKPWKAVTPGRSLPTVLPYTVSQSTQNSLPSADAPQLPPEYVSYSLNGFGRTVGGFGVVINSDTTEFNGQSWMSAYVSGDRFTTDLWNGLSLIFPLSVPAPVTSAFGWRIHPIKGNRRFHSGTDLGAPMGTPVLAAASGKVALSDWLGGYGLAIILSHQDNTQETLYGHLSQVFVKPGQWVERGTIIGRVGSTGLSTGPHLHFELRQKTASGWQAIDPGVQLKYALARLIKAMQSG